METLSSWLASCNCNASVTNSLSLLLDTANIITFKAFHHYFILIYHCIASRTVEIKYTKFNINVVRLAHRWLVSMSPWARFLTVVMFCDRWSAENCQQQYSDVIMSMMASDEKKKDQSSASLAFAREIHRWPVNSPHKWPVTRKMFPFDDVIMKLTKSTAGPGRPSCFSIPK